jgi:hypothetical protein
MQSVLRQRIGKHVLAATNTHATIELLIYFLQYISVYNASYYIVPLPSHNKFRPYTAIISCLYLAKIVALYDMSSFS